MDGCLGTVARAMSALVVAVVIISVPAAAQTGSPAGAARTDTQDGTAIPPGAYVAAVSGTQASARAGAGDAYYPFGVLKSGNLVLVVGRKGDYARVRTVGPAFDPLFGYISLPRSEVDRLQISEDGKTARAIERVDVLAPNLNGDGGPAESWKSIARLEPGRTIKVKERVDTTGDVVFRVALPPDGVGWIAQDSLRAGTVAETRQWEASMEGRDMPPLRPAVANSAPAAVAPVLGREEPAAPRVTKPDVTESALTGENTRQPETKKPAPAPATAVAEAAQSTPAEPDVRKVELAPGAELVEDDAEPANTAAPTRRDAPPAIRENDYEGRLEAMEAAYERLRREDIRTAEVTPLRAMYLELASDSAREPRISRYAEARAEQLTVWTELQERRRELDLMRSRIDEATSEARSIREAMEKSARYDAVGRIAASSIYDGKRLPRLFRLIDPGSGRTLAYLEVTPDGRVETLLGQLAGVIGEKRYDGTLRLNIIDPERIEPLATSEAE